MAVKESGQSAAKRELSHAVKLFGMKISLSVTPADEDQTASRAELAKSEVLSNNAEEIASFSASTSGSDDDKALKREEEEDHAGGGGGGGGGGGVAEVPRRPEEQEDKRSGRPLKRPEKPVSCPRCHSLDTKFCYFNNYNVNQPRHFCKNCQRYWTAGGTLRNVPVGAGRRKNKNGRVESGGGGGGAAASDLPPQQESSERKLAAKLQQQDPSCKVSGASDAGGGGSFGFIRGFSSRTSKANGSRQQQQQTSQQQQQHSGTSEGSNDSRDDSTCGSSVSNPQECTNGGTTNWPYAFFNATGPWNLPGWAGWSSSPWGSMAATAATAAAKVLAQNVHTALGKHIRDEKSVAGAGPAKRPEGSSLWAPKTLRIDAAQAGGDASRGSSFLADIGTGSNKVDTISTGGMFKAFQQETSGTKPGLDDLRGHPKTTSDTNKSSEGT